MSEESHLKHPHRKYAETIFMIGLAGASTLFGFGATVALTKRRSPHLFTQGFSGSAALPESGTDLAIRALGRATLYSCGGFAVFCAIVWKAMGVNNLEEFREKAGSMLPRIPKNNPPQGRTEFASLRDLLEYISDPNLHGNSQPKEKIKQKPEE